MRLLFGVVVVALLASTLPPRALPARPPAAPAPGSEALYDSSAPLGASATRVEGATPVAEAPPRDAPNDPVPDSEAQQYTNRDPLSGRRGDQVYVVPVRPPPPVSAAQWASLQAHAYVWTPPWPDGPREYVIPDYDMRPRPRDDWGPSGSLPGITWSQHPQAGPWWDHRHGRWRP